MGLGRRRLLARRLELRGCLGLDLRQPLLGRELDCSHVLSDRLAFASDGVLARRQALLGVGACRIDARSEQATLAFLLGDDRCHPRLGIGLGGRNAVARLVAFAVELVLQRDDPCLALGACRSDALLGIGLRRGARRGDGRARGLGLGGRLVACRSRIGLCLCDGGLSIGDLRCGLGPRCLQRFARVLDSPPPAHARPPLAPR